MPYTTGQRLGRLTVTQVRRGIAEQVRCDCGAVIDVRLEYTTPAPVGEVGEYHAQWLLAAEAGRLRYDAAAYPIHGVPNNAADALWRGLVADAPGGPVLTPLGAHMLAHWRAAWIRDHIIPAAVWDSNLPEGCPCQWSGPSAHCLHGQHDQCRSTAPVVYPATWLCWPDGRVAAPAPSTSVQVWRTGRPCATPPCSCDCHTTPAETEPVQLGLLLEVQ